jgi:hypothetical protein
MKNTKENNQDHKKTLDGFVNGPTEKTFIKYYEENIRLKKELDERNSTVKELR